MSDLLKCEPCRVNEIDADACTVVSGEPWCDVCVAYHAVNCDRCDNLVADEDSHHGNEGENRCYDCAHKDATD